MTEIVKECQDEARFLYDSEQKANISSSPSIKVSSSAIRASPFEELCSSVPSPPRKDSSSTQPNSFLADIHQGPRTMNHLPLGVPETSVNEDYSIPKQCELDHTHPNYASNYHDINSMTGQDLSNSCAYEMTLAFNNGQGSTTIEMDEAAEHGFTIETETEYQSDNVYFDEGISGVVRNNKQLDYFDL
jgi:hypothetical protein